MLPGALAGPLRPRDGQYPDLTALKAGALHVHSGGPLEGGCGVHGVVLGQLCIAAPSPHPDARPRFWRPGAHCAAPEFMATGHTLKS